MAGSSPCKLAAMVVDLVGKSPMQWSAPMSLFVLNRVCELVEKGIRFDKGFKEHYINKVSNDVLDFTGIIVSTT